MVATAHQSIKWVRWKTRGKWTPWHVLIGGGPSCGRMVPIEITGTDHSILSVGTNPNDRVCKDCLRV